ncbi:MAG: 50S ribosomal protein L21e [archaeon]
MSCKKARGKRANTRAKFSRKGPKPTVNKLLQEIPEGKSVQIKIDSAVHAGMPFRRFHGLTGKVKGRQGSAYLVSISHYGKPKVVLVGAGHVKPEGIAKVKSGMVV